MLEIQTAPGEDHGWMAGTSSGKTKPTEGDSVAGVGVFRMRLHSDGCWLMLALGWDLVWDYQPEHPPGASPGAWDGT